jgi:hypothetical protein
LIAVRRRIPEGQWEAWCADNIHRSMGGIRKMMALARTGDPEAAAEEERSQARERMRAHRAANVRRPGDNAVERLFQQFLQLDEAEKEEFLTLLGKEIGR